MLFWNFSVLVVFCQIKKDTLASVLLLKTILIMLLILSEFVRAICLLFREF